MDGEQSMRGAFHARARQSPGAPPRAFVMAHRRACRGRPLSMAERFRTFPRVNRERVLTPPPCFGGGWVGVERGSARCCPLAALPRLGLFVIGVPTVARDKARQLRSEQDAQTRRFSQTSRTAYRPHLHPPPRQFGGGKERPAILGHLKFKMARYSFLSALDKRRANTIKIAWRAHVHRRVY